MPHRILLVDDEPALLSCLSLFLEDADYQVLTAADGVTALEVLRAEQPDVVVCDLQMPGMDGHEFCERVRQNPEWRSLPVILLSGRGEQVEDALDRVASDYLSKPFEPDHLLAILEANRRDSQAQDHRYREHSRAKTQREV